MSKSYQTSFDSPIPPATLSPGAFKTNIHRNKTKRWVNAPKVDYGEGWGDDYDEDDDYDTASPPADPAGSSGITLTKPLQRRKSFDHGDDVISPPGQGSPSATWHLPPTPLELERHERMGSVPQIQIASPPLQQVQPPPRQVAPWSPSRGELSIQIPTSVQQTTSSAPEPEQWSQFQPGSMRNEIISSPSYAPQEPVSPSDSDLSQSYRTRERVPLPLGVESTSQSSVDAVEEHAPQIPDELRPQEGERLPASQHLPHIQMPNTDKPTPPLPPPEDNSLKTISEHDSVISGPSSPTNSGALAPGYCGYQEDYHAGQIHLARKSYYEESVAPYYSPSIPSAMDQPVSPTPPSPASISKPRIIRPSDIYKRHQEELERQPGCLSRGMDSVARPPIDPHNTPSPVAQLPIDLHNIPSPMDSVARPSIDPHNAPSAMDSAAWRPVDIPSPINSPRPPTAESVHSIHCQLSELEQPQQLAHASSKSSDGPTGRNGASPPSQETVLFANQAPQEDPSAVAAVTANSVILENAVDVRASVRPFSDEEAKAAISVSSVGTVTTKSGLSTLPSGPSHVASSTGVSHSPVGSHQGPGGGVFQAMVESAFVRHDTLLPTPCIDSSPNDEAISHIPPPPPVPPPVPPEDGNCEWKTPYASPSQRSTPTPPDLTRELRGLSPPPGNTRTPSPDSWRQGAKTASTPIVLPPIPTEGVTGIMAETTRVDAEKNDLDTLVFQLERAQTPDLRSPDTSGRTSDPNPQAGDSQRDAAQPPNPRESMGVFSLYDSYWEESADGATVPAVPVASPPPPIQPKSPLRNMPPGNQRFPLTEFEPATTKSPSPPPVVTAKETALSSLAPVAIPEPQKAQRGSEELGTPASSVDEELLEMLNASNRFLDRRATGSPLKDINGDHGQLSSVIGAGHKLPPAPVVSPDSEGIQSILPSKPLGPESEGIEVITGPTVEKRPKTIEDADTIAGSEYARELVNQFSRPQTLMLKDTMPMPSGMLVMPAMPPLPGKEAGETAPDVVNFDKDDVEAPEVVDAQVSSPAPPVPSDNSRPQTRQTTRASNPKAVLQDTATIATLSTSAERSMAYDALRADIADTPDQISEWIAYQMEHNNGQQLLMTEVVSVKQDYSMKKSKSRIGLGHFPSRSGDHFEEGSAHRAEERLSQMGRGALKLGEKAGGKVGGWVRRVGKKEHANASKESARGDNFGYYVGDDQQRGAPVGASAVSLAGTYAPTKGLGGASVGSSSGATSQERRDSIDVPSPSLPQQSLIQHQPHPSTPPTQPLIPPIPQQHHPPQPYPSAPPQLLPIQTRFQAKPTIQSPQPTPSHNQTNSGEQTRTHTPNQCYRLAPIGGGNDPASRSASSTHPALDVASQPSRFNAPPPPSNVPPPPSHALTMTFPTRTDSLGSQATTQSRPKNTPPLVQTAFPQRGDSLAHTKDNSSSVSPPHPQPSTQNMPEDSDDDLYSLPAKPKPQGHQLMLPPPEKEEYMQEASLQENPQPLSHAKIPLPPPPPPQQQQQYRPYQSQEAPPAGSAQIHTLPAGQTYPPLSSQASNNPGQIFSPPSSHASYGLEQSPTRYSTQFPEPLRQPQQLPLQPLSPPSRGSGLIKTLSHLGPANKHSIDGPPRSSSSNEKPKRSSFLGNLSSKLDGAGRSGTVNNSQAADDINDKPKVVKRGSLLTKLGQIQKDGKSPKGHKKVFSVFSRSASTAGSSGIHHNDKFGRLAKAGLMGGGSGDAAGLIKDQPKIYNAQTGQYVTYEQAAQSSIGNAPYQQCYSPPSMRGVQHQMAQPGPQNPPHYIAAQQTESHQPNHGPPQSSPNYRPGGPQQQLGQHHQAPRGGPPASVHSCHSSQMSKEQSITGHPTPPPHQMHDGAGQPIYPHQQQNNYGPTPGSTGMLNRQPTYPLHESQGHSQGMSPPNFLHRGQSVGGHPQAHPQDYQQQQFRAYQHGPMYHPQPAPQQQWQYVPPPVLQDNAGYQQPPQQPQPTPPSQLPPLLRLGGQHTRSSTSPSMDGSGSHRGFAAESGMTSGSTPPPHQYGDISPRQSVAGNGERIGSPQQYVNPQPPQQPQSSPQVSRSSTVASNGSGVSAQGPPPPPKEPERPPSPDSSHEPQPRIIVAGTGDARPLAMVEKRRSPSPGEHEGGVGLNPGNIETTTQPPPLRSNDANPPMPTIPATAIEAKTQVPGGEPAKHDRSESSRNAIISVTPPPPPSPTIDGEGVKGKDKEGKVAARYEGDGEKEVVSEQKKPGKKDDEDGLGYMMSSTSYPGQQWEPDYYGWS